MLQEDGYGLIVGRTKDVIIRIGDKIFPTEVEDFFMEHPHVLEAQVKYSLMCSIFKEKHFFCNRNPPRRQIKKEFPRFSQRILSIYVSCVL